MYLHADYFFVLDVQMAGPIKSQIDDIILSLYNVTKRINCIHTKTLNITLYSHTFFNNMVADSWCIRQMDNIY